MAQVPALKAVPDFNLEEELGHATEFLLESAVAPDKKNPVKPQSLNAAKNWPAWCRLRHPRQHLPDDTTTSDAGRAVLVIPRAYWTPRYQGE